MNYLNRFLLTFIVLGFALMPVSALEFDLSVDEEIRKNYNPSQIELDNLPPLPKEHPTQPSKPITSIPNSSAIPTQKLSTPTSKPVIANVDKSTAIRIPKGTKFRVKSNQTISDYTKAGTRLTFVSQKPVTKRYVTILEGTVFKGEVTDSHTPQLSGNGGLIVLKIDSMIFKGATVPVNAKITKAAHKKIFINNIKGERKYLKGIANSTKPGKKFYRKMMRTTSKLANGPVTLILTPFTVVSGVVVYAANVVSSPVLALFSKGGHINIPAGSEFEIKLLEDAYLY